MSYVIPTELKSEILMFKKISLADVVFIAGYASIMYFLLGDFVHSSLNVLFIFWNIGVGLMLRIKTSHNHKRLMYSIYYMLIKDRVIYHPISR